MIKKKRCVSVKKDDLKTLGKRDDVRKKICLFLVRKGDMKRGIQCIEKGDVKRDR